MDDTGWLADSPTLANAIRLFIIFVGFTLAMLSMKVAGRAARFRDWERFCGAMAYASIVITPATFFLWRFDFPLLPIPTVVYCIGLTFGVVATYLRVTLRWNWWQRLAHGKRGSRARR